MTTNPSLRQRNDRYVTIKPGISAAINLAHAAFTIGATISYGTSFSPAVRGISLIQLRLHDQEMVCACVTAQPEAIRRKRPNLAALPQ
jgi:hypothetical protein